MLALSVIVADDHQIVRSGLKQLIAAQPDLRLEAECRTGAETLDALSKRPCHVLMLDLALPDMSGVDVLKQTKVKHPSVGVLIVSGYPERQFGINALRAGARGFINKGVDEKELLKAVRQVARGGRYVGPDLADLLIGGLDGDAAQPPHTHLSEREFQVFCKLADGMSLTEIAEHLSLSIKTVSTYRMRVLEKMAMETNADLTRYALRNQLIQ